MAITKQSYINLAVGLGCCLLVFLTLFKRQDDICAAFSAHNRAVQLLVGQEPVLADQEKRIRQIAAEMNITQPFIVRKMTQYVMSQLGYFNAAVLFPMMFNFIPVTHIPMLLISESFFEDLSLAEQRFLIGHEMIHIRESHCKYANLIVALLVWLLALCIFLLVSPIKKMLLTYFSARLSLYLSVCILAGLFCSNVALLGIAHMTYRRIIERQADLESLAILSSYEGAALIMEKFEKVAKISKTNWYQALWVDHPSNIERKLYCLELQNRSKA